MNEQQQQTQRILIGIVLVAALSLLFGVLRLRGIVGAPILAGGQGSSLKKDVTTVPHLADAVTLQQQDTDGDGLNDYDELNRYTTSPYLSDSDSDGLTDAVEVRSGTDPNCPKGQECSIRNILPSAQEGLELPITTMGAGGALTLPPFDPEGVRTFLITLGELPEEQVAALDEVSLRKVYDALGAYLPGGDGLSSLNNTPRVPSPETLSAGQIRELLRQNGIADSLLQDVDDATLQRVFLETMSQYEKTNE